jgi:hypothetical protein
MPLPTVNWKYVGALNHTASSINSALDAVYTLGTAVTYADGSPRVPGTGSAWTWNREIIGVTVATYGAPPTNALNFRYIIGGTLLVSAYPILTPDTATLGNIIVYGMNRNSGAYTSWANAQPFTSGFSGYWRATTAYTNPYDSVTMWESQEGCAIQFNRLGTGNISAVNFGALFDPLTASTLIAESDGRVYSMSGTGSSSIVSGNWLANSGTASVGLFGSGSTTASLGHAGTLAPGSTVMVGGAGVQTARFGDFSVTTSLVSPNGDIVRIPFSQLSTAGNYLGQGRNLFLIKDAISRQTYTSGATAVGYIFGSSTTGTSDSVLLGA